MRAYLLSVWNFLDPIYYFFTRLTYLEKTTDGKTNMLRVRMTRYKGRDVTLSDGTEIKKNDFLVKIHLHNVRLMNEMKHIKNEVRKGRFIRKCVENSLPELVNFIQQHEKKDTIKGIIGITTLTKGSKYLGFEVFDMANPFYKWFKFISFLPICVLSSSKPVSMKKQPPKYLLMSKEMLVNKYGN
ncbi:hypothetical protein [Bacillus sp. FJAT-47783]|uniref:YkoP family protein n=1 Tax=Bacillus sp. FJAT-47783 TaxID=2922712 RepID=UPI001FAB4772|nr:hypothetical protein [Bacillus sp. FJAT-47783]